MHCYGTVFISPHTWYLFAYRAAAQCDPWQSDTFASKKCIVMSGSIAQSVTDRPAFSFSPHFYVKLNIISCDG